MKVMLTGGSGHIGRRVAARIGGMGEVVNVDRAPAAGGWAGRTEIVDLATRGDLDRLNETWDAIVHLAAIPNPTVGTWDEVMRVNMVGTYNVLRYAVERQVPRVIFGSSESASGWGIHGRWYHPDYIPIDEKHPSLPSEVYSYTKAFGDQLCQGFSREHDLQTICLRYAWVLFPPQYAGFIARVRQNAPRDALGATYAWVDVEDVAAAVEHALRMPMEAGQSETFYITAREHYGTLSTPEMIKRNWGTDMKVDAAYYAENPFGSFFDIRKAERMMGWRPAWTVERVVSEKTDVDSS